MDPLSQIQQKNSLTCTQGWISSELQTDKFYDPNILKSITCLLQSMPKTGSLDSRIRNVFGKRKVPEMISVRTPQDQSQAEALLNEAYIGIVYLNDLRGATPSFKYIFDYVDGQVIEETMEDFPLIEDYLPTLLDTEGVKFDSIVAQLLLALEMAHRQGVSGFPHKIRVRPTTMDKINGIPTYGQIPVFSRFYSARAQGGQDLNSEKIALYCYLLKLVSKPNLGVSEPQVRIKTYIRSVTNRLEALANTLQREHVPYLVWPVFWEYILILENLDPQAAILSKIKSMRPTETPNPEEMRVDLDRLVPYIKEVQDKIFPEPDVSSMSGYYKTLITLRDTIRDQTFLKTCQAAIEAYRPRSGGSYPLISTTGRLHQAEEALTLALREQPHFDLTSLEDALTLTLYSYLMGPIDKTNTDALKHFMDLNPELVKPYNDRVYLDSILVSDPVPIFTK